VVIWYISPRFGILYQEKSGNPEFEIGAFSTGIGMPQKTDDFPCNVRVQGMP
jgi:hypothetical protein